jgi:hypothetical protein
MFLAGWSQSNKPMAKIKLVLDQRRPNSSLLMRGFYRKEMRAISYFSI